MIWSNVIILIIFIIFVAYKIHDTVTEHNKEAEYIAENYPDVQLTETFNCKVTSIYSGPSHYRKTCHIEDVTLATGKSYRLSVSTLPATKDVCFSDIVKTGVVLRKNAGSDTLTVVTDSKEFQFLLD